MQGETFVDALTKILVKRNVIPAHEGAELRKAFKDSEKANFDEFLIDEGLVSKDDLLPALSELYQVPDFDAVGYFFDHQLLHMFPKEFLISNEIIPLERDENILVFIASNPNNQELLPRIGEYVSDDVQFQVGLRQDIIDAIDEYYDQALTEVNPDLDEDFDETAQEREREIEVDNSLERLYEEEIESAKKENEED